MHRLDQSKTIRAQIETNLELYVPQSFDRLLVSFIKCGPTLLRFLVLPRLEYVAKVHIWNILLIYVHIR